MTSDLEPPPGGSDAGTAGCSKLVRLLADYIEGRLPPLVQAELDQHLAACDTCVRQVRTYRSTVSLLKSLKEADLPRDLRLSLRAFLDEHGSN